MPTYKDEIQIEYNGNNYKIYLFDYSTNVVFEKDEPRKKKGPKVKQLISVLSCMTFGTKNLTALNEEHREPALQAGLEYSGYFVRTLNGPYDYCYKIWTDRRLPIAPLNFKLPRKGEVLDAIIIDRNKGYFGIACGPHLAYCKTSALLKVGLKSADVKLPHPGLRVKLERISDKRPSEMPYVAYEAIPVIEAEDKEQEEEEEEEEEKEEQQQYEYEVVED